MIIHGSIMQGPNTITIFHSLETSIRGMVQDLESFQQSDDPQIVSMSMTGRCGKT